MNATFNRLVSAAPTITFNAEWKNGTGYLDHAVEGPNAPSLEMGQVVTCKDNWGRDVLLFGTDKQNIAVFQRFSGNAPDGVLVANFNYEMRKDICRDKPFTMDSAITEPEMAWLVELLAAQISHREATHYVDYVRLLAPWSVI